jgi:uncharacterized protein YycO
MDTIYKRALRHLVLDICKPGVDFVTSISLPYSKKKITGETLELMQPYIKNGTVVLSHTEGSFGNFMIPDFWKHAGIVTTINGKFYVIEATRKGVVATHIITHMLSKDYLCLLEPNLFIDQEQAKPSIMISAGSLAREQVGKPYDLNLEWQQSDQKAFYCSELVVWSYLEIARRNNYKWDFPLKLTWGEETCTPNDIYETRSHFRSMFDSRSIVR